MFFSRGLRVNHKGKCVNTFHVLGQTQGNTHSRHTHPHTHTLEKLIATRVLRWRHPQPFYLASFTANLRRIRMQLASAHSTLCLPSLSLTLYVPLPGANPAIWWSSGTIKSEISCCACCNRCNCNGDWRVSLIAFRDYFGCTSDPT